ncbi:MAG: hypothetical protein IJE85_06160 [Bacteroidales bacterium]|nr:hypothetical protein [Bacteroidales bacterium]
MMKKIIYIAAAALMLFACKPEAYVGPLDSPVGNWEGIGCDFYFNGELVGDADSSFYSAMTFYKGGLCCIEDVKGAFPYKYDAQSHILQIDSVYWAVQNMHSEDLTLKFLGRIYPTPPSAEEEVKSDEDGSDEGGEEGDGSEGEEEQGPKPDKNGIILPVEYKGVTISADENDYFYTDSNGSKIYCTPVGEKNEEGIMAIALWYDTRTDYYIPLVVELEKK